MRRYIPSVPATCGSSNAPLPHGRHGPIGGGSATRSGSAARAHSSTSIGLGARQRAHRVHEPATRTAPSRPRSSSSSRCSAASSLDRAGLDPPARFGPAPQHPEARARRVEQDPVERRRRRTASRRPSAATGATAAEAEPRRGPLAPARGGPGGRRPPPPRRRSSIASAIAVTFPPGRGADLEHPLARARADRGGDRLAPLVLWRRAPVGDGRRSGPGRRHRARSARRAGAGRARPRAGRDQLGLDRRPRSARRGLTRSVSAGGSFAISSAARPSSTPRSANIRATIQSGIDVRTPTASTESPSGHGHGGPRSATRRSTAFDEPLRSRRDAARARRRSRRPRRAARRLRPAGTRRAAARRAPARRRRRGRGRAPARAARPANGAGAASRRRARWSGPAPAARARSCAGARAAGRSRTRPPRPGPAPRARPPAASSSRERCRAAVAGAPRVVRHRPLSLGLDLVGHEPIVLHVARATPSAACRRRRSTRPGRGLPARTVPHQLGRGRARIELELLDGQLLRVRRLADLRSGLGARDLGDACASRSSVPIVDEAVVQLTRGLGRVDRRCGRTRRPARCRGRLRSP